MAYSELIKNFNRIRDYMREFYVYGFKSRDEYTQMSGAAWRAGLGTTCSSARLLTEKMFLSPWTAAHPVIIPCIKPGRQRASLMATLLFTLLFLISSVTPG